MKILIAMSGGVDSSVAAKLLCDAGNECIGCTMKLFDNCDAGLSRSRTCCSLDDIEDARSVAFSLGMRYYVFNFKDDFREKVIKKFASAYIAGQTPNPCIDCNRYMKFDKLYERARLLGCDKIATGHYARIEFDGEKYMLKKARDESKDQSYVLYMLTQEQLAHTLFPLGELIKSETRAIAEASKLTNAQKPDSQDICFVPDGDYAAAIERLTGKTSAPGNFIDTDGNVLGTHRGITHYTIGQHRGLGLALPERRYVCKIDAGSGTVTLGSGTELYSREVLVRDFNWISGEAPSGPIRCSAKIRYRQPEQAANVEPLSENEALIRFDTPQSAVTPGQSAVLYDDGTVLGGGIIVR